MQVAIAALVIALVLWLPAAVANGCPDPGYCDDFERRLRAAPSPGTIGRRLRSDVALGNGRTCHPFRSMLAPFEIASIGMAVVTLVLGTDLRLALRPLGLSSASGFVLYAASFVIADAGPFMALRRAQPSPRHQAVM